ncbi:MAG: tRNA (adenosine(37)-N6)-dimethylallyltransferase MiaA, partial [Flavobacterium sp.]|nr:tRNA (adenosine(37)-N6)-dimethylallyltransferase MiaA [Aeromicrobium sp.]
MSVTDHLVVIVGPTASGKSSLAVDIARRMRATGHGGAGHPAEIVNADSMQLYRGMDIGRAKPRAAESQVVPPHLFDVLEVTETAPVAEFQTLARASIADCFAGGVVPVLVGGSALYVRA